MDPVYGEDLAFIHEAGFSDLASAAARHLRSLVQPPGLVADLGCGGGTLLSELMGAGFDGWGVDLSPHMVALARRLVPDADVVVGSVFAVQVPPCQAVTAVGEVMNHALGERGADATADLLHDIHGSLRPGGILLFDVATTERPPGRTRAQRSGRGWRIEATTDVAGDRLVRTIDAWRTVRGQERHSREVHRIPLVDSTWSERCLADAGFSVERLGGYDDHAFQPGWDGFVARKA